MRHALFPAPPKWVPPEPFDSQADWEGPLAEVPEVTVQIIFTRQRSGSCRRHLVRARTSGCSHPNWPGRRAELPDYFPDARLFSASGNHPVVRKPRSNRAADSTRSAGLGFLCFARKPVDSRKRPEGRLNGAGNFATESYTSGMPRVTDTLVATREGILRGRDRQVTKCTGRIQPLQLLQRCLVKAQRNPTAALFHPQLSRDLGDTSTSGLPVAWTR